jgi:hypothetical protein
VNRNDVERLLQDVARDRAGEPVDAPGPGVLGDLRSRGRARRQRRTRQVMTALVVTVVVGLLALTRMAAGGADSDRLDVVEPPTTTTTSSTTTSTSSSTTTPSTTTSTSSPSGSGESSVNVTRGMPTSDYRGLEVTASSIDGAELAVSGGQALDYLTVTSRQEAPGDRTILLLTEATGAYGEGAGTGAASDDDRTMVWLLGPGWPASATVLDAAQAPWTTSTALGTSCTADGVADQIVALVDMSSPSEPSVVMAAWTTTADSPALTPIPASTPVACTN